jgi:ribosome-associated protein
MTRIAVTPELAIDDSELDESFVQATGPGGQNVNKVATAVQLRFDAAGSLSLPAQVRERLSLLAGRRMTKDGVLILTARRYRTQERNREDARERLVELIREAAHVAPPRRATKLPRAAKKRRQDYKKKHATLKRQRRRPHED